MLTIFNTASSKDLIISGTQRITIPLVHRDSCIYIRTDCLGTITHIKICNHMKKSCKYAEEVGSILSLETGYAEYFCRFPDSFQASVLHTTSHFLSHPRQFIFHKITIMYNAIQSPL